MEHHFIPLFYCGGGGGGGGASLTVIEDVYYDTSCDVYMEREMTLDYGNDIGYMNAILVGHAGNPRAFVHVFQKHACTYGKKKHVYTMNSIMNELFKKRERLAEPVKKSGN